MSTGAPDPGDVHTIPELTAALEALRDGRSYAHLYKESGGRLPRSTVSDLFHKGRPTRETLEAFLRACDVPRRQWQAWHEARERALTANDPGTAGLVRVAEADPRRLGVHAAIAAPGATGELPVYVERDTDTAVGGVRALIQKAARGRGGLVVLVGGSSVGKTRCAYEAVRHLLPTWWLLHPADTEQIHQLAAAPPPRLVVWLDELQRYLGGPTGLRASTVRSLLAQGAVLVATLWPERHRLYNALPQSGQSDPYAAEREVLSLADVVHIDSAFSPAERRRAHQAAKNGDARIALALESASYGLTQTIAAAPQLVHHWRGADPYQKAVLNAAIDATRLGVQSRLSTGFLREAAPGYCDARHRALAPPNWFEAALAYATEPVHGAIAALSPLAEAMGRPVGYAVADYLLQHASNERRTAVVPATTWDACLTHVADPADQNRLADQASGRLLYLYAQPLYAKAASAGIHSAAVELAELLLRQGRKEEAISLLRAPTRAGDSYASVQLIHLLAEEGRSAEARTYANAGNEEAVAWWANQLIDQGLVDDALEWLRMWVRAGLPFAVTRLGSLLADQGRVEEAIAFWRSRIEAGDNGPTLRLADLLARNGRVEEAMALWRARAEAGDHRAGTLLALRLAKRGQVDEAMAFWRSKAEAGDSFSSFRYANLMAEQGRVEDAIALLQERAQAGDNRDALHLAELFVKYGRAAEAIAFWRARAEAGDNHAALRLAELLAEQGHTEEAIAFLQARGEVHDSFTAKWLAEHMVSQGRVETAMELLRASVAAGHEHAADELARLLVSRL